MRYKDMVDITLAAEDETAILAALAILEEKLPLIGLSKTQIRRTSHLGQKNESFVMEAIEAGRQNAALIPPNVSLVAIDRDLTAREQLNAIALRVERLHEKLRHTRIGLGADLYGAARAIYKAFQEFGRDAGIAETVDRLALRFKPHSRSATSGDTLAPGPGGGAA